MRHHRLGIITIICYLAVLCIQFQEASEAQVDPFRVGMILPLSGPLAEYGIACRNGIELAQQAHPEIFKGISFIYEDSQWDPKSAVSGFHRLKDLNRAQLIFNWGNPTSEPLAPLAKRYRIPLLAMSSDSELTRNNQFVIRTINSSSQLAAPLAKFLAHSRYRRIGVVIAQNTYLRGLFQYIKENIRSDQSITLIDTFSLNELDFRSAIPKIKSADYDVIGVFLISGQIAAFNRSLQQYGVYKPIFGGDFFESSTEIAASNGAMNGAVYAHLATRDRFIEEYRQRYVTDHQVSYAGHTHDIALAIATQFHNLNRVLSPEEVLMKLRQVISFQGVTGSFRFEDTPESGPQFHFPVRLKMITGSSILTASDS